MLKGRFFAGLLVCLMLFLAVPLTVNADKVYVHPTEGAYHTIADGVGVAAAGDTVLVGPGNYGSFTVEKKLYIISEAGPDMTKITSGGSVTFTADADGSLISGFTITIPGDSGIYVNSACDYLRIENNIISGCGSHGIHLYGACHQHLSYITILNNSVAYNGGSGIYFERTGCYSDDGRFKNFSVVNNIFHHNTAYGISSNSSSGYFITCSFPYNDFWANTAGSTSVITATATDGNLFVDPLFLNPDTGDLHLQAASECIDAGKVGSPYNDPDGTRNDIGVYGGPGAANFWPYPAGGPVVTDLSVTPPSVPVGGTLTLKATGKIR